MLTDFINWVDGNPLSILAVAVLTIARGIQRRMQSQDAVPLELIELVKDYVKASGAQSDNINKLYYLYQKQGVMQLSNQADIMLILKRIETLLTNCEDKLKDTN